MARYLVEVNGFYLVTLNAESPLAAEHVMLSMEGVGTAMAYSLEDPKEIRTETFRGALYHGSTSSVEELAGMSKGLEYQLEDFERAKAAEAELRKHVNELEKELESCRLQLIDAAAATQAAEDDILNQWSLMRTPDQGKRVIR